MQLSRNGTCLAAAAADGAADGAVADTEAKAVAVVGSGAEGCRQRSCLRLQGLGLELGLGLANRLVDLPRKRAVDAS